jgi:hypothetical protein
MLVETELSEFEPTVELVSAVGFFVWRAFHPKVKSHNRYDRTCEFFPRFGMNLAVLVCLTKHQERLTLL